MSNNFNLGQVSTLLNSERKLYRTRTSARGVENMADNLYQVSLDEMFKTYLNCGGEPITEDLAAFTYDDETKLLDKATKEADLGPIIVSGSPSPVFAV